MKQIWNECQKAGDFRYRYAYRANVYDATATVYAVTVANYDKGTRVLYVEHSAHNSDETEWTNYPDRIEHLEVMRGPVSKESLCRHVIDLADAWIVKVALSIPLPDTRTDEQVRADAEKDELDEVA